MRKLIVIILTIQIAGLCLYGQDTAKNEQVKQLTKKNQTVVSYFKEGDYKKAQAVAEEAVELSKTVYGDEHIETAAAYKNLGEIFRVREKYDNAIENFTKALEIYQLKPEDNVSKTLSVIDSLGTVLAFDGKKKEAVEMYSQYLEIAEAKYGKESAELLPYLKDLTNFYLYIKDFDKADEALIRRKIIAIKTNSRTSIDSIQDETTCYLYQNLSPKELEEREKKIVQAVSDAIGAEQKEPNPLTIEVKRINGGIINGKAKRLVQPKYPLAARTARIRGTVLVNLVIGKDGSILSAKAICGHPILRKAAEDAAKMSKFTTTKLLGEAVEVSGVVMYSFN